MDPETGMKPMPERPLPAAVDFAYHREVHGPEGTARLATEASDLLGA